MVGNIDAEVAGVAFVGAVGRGASAAHSKASHRRAEATRAANDNDIPRSGPAWQAHLDELHHADTQLAQARAADAESATTTARKAAALHGEQLCYSVSQSFNRISRAAVKCFDASIDAESASRLSIASISAVCSSCEVSVRPG